MKMDFKLDAQNCTGCGLCAADCPSGVLLVRHGKAQLRPGGEDACIGCRHCFAVCPTGALSVFGRVPGGTETPKLPTFEEMAALLRFRRSVRRFDDKPLSREDIARLLAPLAYSPTGCNDHRLKFCAVSGSTLDFLRAELPKRVLSALDGDALPHRFELFRRMETPLRHGVDMIFRTAPHCLFVCSPVDAPCPAQDAVIALSEFELLSQTAGVGTTWCGLAVMSLALAPDLLPKIGVPKGYNIGFSMLFGRSAAHYCRDIQPDPADVFFAD